MTSAVLALAALLASAAPAMPRKPRMDKSMETDGSYSKVAKPGHLIIETPAQWTSLWHSLGKNAPGTDLTKNYAVAAFAGQRNSGGFAISWEKPVEEKGALVIRYKVLRPKGMAIMAITQPYSVRLFPRNPRKLPVRVEGREE